MSTSRLETFADGVLAIAATLLILNVDAQIAHGDPLSRLQHAWPSYAAYVVSFLTIGIIWVNHHVLMTQVDHADRMFLFLNVLFLMCVSFIPFPTRLVAEHFRKVGAREAALAYGGTLTSVAICFNLMWFYAAGRRRLLRADMDAKTVSGISRSYIFGPWTYLAITLVALASPTTSIVLYGAYALFWVLESSLFARRGATRP